MHSHMFKRHVAFRGRAVTVTGKMGSVGLAATWERLAGELGSWGKS